MTRSAEEMLKSVGMKPASSRAVVSVTLSVETSSWGADCTIAQAVMQATREAREEVERLIQEHGRGRGITISHIGTTRVVFDADKERP